MTTNLGAKNRPPRIQQAKTKNLNNLYPVKHHKTQSQPTETPAYVPKTPSVNELFQNLAENKSTRSVQSRKPLGPNDIIPENEYTNDMPPLGQQFINDDTQSEKSDNSRSSNRKNTIINIGNNNNNNMNLNNNEHVMVTNGIANDNIVSSVIPESIITNYNSNSTSNNILSNGNTDSPKLSFSASSVSHTNSQRPVFQFKIGMSVGIALGDCYLDLQKLESNVLRLQNISDEIRDYMCFIRDNYHYDFIGDIDEKMRKFSKDRSRITSGSRNDSNFKTPSTPSSSDEKNKFKNKTDKNGRSISPSRENGDASTNTNANIISPFDDTFTLNDKLEYWQKDTQNRMKSLKQTLKGLQIKLEELDEYHSDALLAHNNIIGSQTHSNSRPHSRRNSVEKGVILNNNNNINDNNAVRQLEYELEKCRNDIRDKQNQITKLRSDLMESNQKFESQKKLLEQREQQLDQDAEDIARQSEELRKESERLYKERDEIKKLKDHWNKLIQEQKETNDLYKQKDMEISQERKQILDLQTQLNEKEKKLHRKAKKIKAREKRLDTIQNKISQTHKNLLTDNNSNHQLSTQKEDESYPKPKLNSVHKSNASVGQKSIISDVDSELTYFSDGETEIASVNSLSEDEEEELKPSVPHNVKSVHHLKAPSPPPY